MRIARIDLIRWGKFTDKVIELPKSECDFHLIVGANEAGKSTLREAISDLLYGVPKFTPFSFFHARSELRLAATLEHAGKSLVFHRTSGTKSPLRDTDDNPLVDEALAPFVGATGREFFEQMFGLDHARLVEGSQRFLSPNDSVGAKLFEAASGMASVSQMRDALEADAKDIVSRSKASELAEARAQLKQAQDALKQATVRTRDWSQAEDEFVRLEKALAELRQRKEALATEQNQLLRVQRVAPHLSAWADARTALTELEDAVELPADAAAILASAQTELSKASAEFGIHAEHMKRAAESIAAITLDEPVLAVADDIVALEESRQRFATHTRDIDLRQRELDTEWELARRRAVELGWTLTDEGSLVAALPDPITRKRLDTLARGCEALKTKADGARRARDSTKEDIADAQSALKNLTVLQLPGGFRPALASAQGAIQSASQFDEAHALVERRRAALEKARVALGEWVAGEEILRAMVLPAESEVDATAQALKDAHSGVATCERELRDCDSDLAAKKLAIEQHSQAHSPVTHEEVGQLRESRDGVWRAIRDGQTQLSDGAAEYEGLVVQADDAADRRQATANESATLQSMRREEQSLELKRDDATRRLEQAKTELARQGDAWQDRAAGLGLAGLALDAAAGWMRQREACLAAFDGLHEAQLNLEQMQRQRAQIRDSLTQLLDQAGQAADSNAELPVLAEAAQDLVARADHASGERKKTEELLEKARGLLQRQEKEFDEATVSRDEWQRDWAAVLESAKLDAQTRPEDAAAIEGCLVALGNSLARIRDLRVNRIEAMQNDLAGFAEAARVLAARVAPELRHESAGEISRALKARLQAAQADKGKLETATTDRDAANRSAQLASEKIARTRATLAPLLALAGVDTNEELPQAIERSDARRRTSKALESEEQRLRDLGGGLSREALEAEREKTDLDQLPARLATLQDELEEIDTERDGLVAKRTDAKRAVDAIAGRNDAALAEGRKQEALARIADAVERYARVRVAINLLDWAIEQYRESKQGPMVERAGEIFSRLTLGEFERLSVEYGSSDPELQGRRFDGNRVPVAGMSDGTRDQLYLALRLAALQMHVAGGHALPFIADDLFINFDDGRAKAGFEALGELSRGTQVVYMTHHEHLVEVARRALGGNVSVVRL